MKDAKLAIDFKLSQWLPLQDRRRGLAGGSAPAPLTSEFGAREKGPGGLRDSELKQNHGDM